MSCEKAHINYCYVNAQKIINVFNIIGCAPTTKPRTTVKIM